MHACPFICSEIRIKQIDRLARVPLYYDPFLLLIRRMHHLLHVTSNLMQKVSHTVLTVLKLITTDCLCSVDVCKVSKSGGGESRSIAVDGRDGKDIYVNYL